jgi:hypothetical protein
VSKIILRHANLSTTQRYLGRVNYSEAARWIESLQLMKNKGGKNVFSSFLTPLRRPAFRHILMRQKLLIPLLRNIQPAITAAVFLNVCLPVCTGADDVFVGLSVIFCQPAGAGHVAVALPVEQQRFQQGMRQLLIPVEEIPLGFLAFLQYRVQFVGIHLFQPQLAADDMFLKTDNSFVADDDHGKGLLLVIT